MLVRLLYASRAVESVHNEAVLDILAKARQHNPQHGLTGILCYSEQTFMQVLEGSRQAVNALYARILADRRHRDVVLLHYEEICERRFAGWTMGQVQISKLNPSILLKYSDLPVLNPHALSGRASMALIEELLATAAIVGRS